MTKFSVASETSFLRAGLSELKDYLLSNEIFWNAGASQQLTLGNLLLAKEYLDGIGRLPAAEAKELAALKKEWRSAWEKKAEREFGARLRQWTQYLNELSEHPDRHSAYYATEVRVRALLEQLAPEAPGLRGQLAAADSALKALTVGGEFVWGNDAEAAFPKGKYWFLWVKMK
ncbi:MAG: hypothetical protein WEA61_01695 [Anaerolineales bacterium]